MEELLTIYEWPEKLFKQRVKEVSHSTKKLKNFKYPDMISGNLKCLKSNQNE